ncbi:uncharacterized protein LOC143983433 [Lithobates pipiens]
MSELFKLETGTPLTPSKQGNRKFGRICHTDSSESLSVINLSSYVLSSVESDVLARGLTFCPQANLDPFGAITDIQLFARRLLLKSLHAKNTTDTDITDWSRFSMREFKALRDLTLLYEENNTVYLIDQIDLEALLETADEPTRRIQHNFKKPSGKFPPLSLNSNIDIFVKLVARDICKLSYRKSDPDNLNKEEAKALDMLTKNVNITTKPSDKGGNVVLMDNSDYVRMCQDILDNKEWYKVIPSKLIQTYYDKFYNFIDTALTKGGITREQHTFVRTKHPRVPTFYSLPKIHKCQSRPPGRPIVSGRGGIAENLSKVIDSYLQPFVTCMPSYVKDTTHLLQTIENYTLTDKSILVAIDVEALYSSIPHNCGVEAIRNLLQTSGKYACEVNEFIVNGLNYILHHNFFLFNNSHYLQVQGVAMGTCCAPAYANLYLGEWEKSLLGDEGLVGYTRHIAMWRRYIDDVLIIWEGSETALLEFESCINTNKYNLKFTMTYDTQSITFLDVIIGRTPENSIYTSLYRKSTAGNTVLHADSFHPIALKQSIPYGQYLRLCRNCSNDSLFREEAYKLQIRFLARGYSRSCLRRAFNKVVTLPRKDLLFSKKTRDDPMGNLPRITMRFTKQHNIIYNIIQKYWPILSDDPKIGRFVATRPSISFKRASSLHDRLVQSEYMSAAKRSKHCSVFGSFPCNHCSCCKYIRRDKTFCLPNGGIFRPIHFVNCQTRGIVYFMECECGAYYVGKTKQEFHRRISKHVYSMEIGNYYLPVGRHVVTVHDYRMPKFTFVALDRIHIPARGGDWNKILLQREQRWIHNLDATSAPGLNESTSFAPFLKGFSSGKTQ